jgi:glycosyltransferase involved in cell wall biosynthesis
MKNHIGLIKAFDRLALSKPNVQLVLVGRGTANIDINEYISNSRIHTLGERENIPELMSTFDALVLCSLYGEGFPNVVGEAMLTGLPVIVTDVGDSALMTGGNGITIPANSPSHLYHAMCEIMSWDVERLDSVRVRSRQHIINNYDILAVADRYEKLWRDLYQQTLS